MTHKLIVSILFFFGVACEGTSVGNPAPKEPTDRECKSISSPLSGDEIDILSGEGGAKGTTVDELLASVDGSYDATLEWMVDGTVPETAALEVSVEVVGEATFYESDPANDSFFCDPVANIGFPAAIRVTTADGRLNETFETEGFTNNEQRFSAHITTTLGDLQGAFAELFPDTPTSARVLVIIRVTDDILHGSISVSEGSSSSGLGGGVGSAGSSRAAQFPVGGY